MFVDFWAPWCGPCRQTSPLIEELANELDASKIKIGKLNVDENPNLASHYGVMSIPTFKIFKGGQPVDEAIGGMTKEKLKAFMEKNF